MIACFMSKPFMGVSASGCHHNVSLWRGGENTVNRHSATTRCPVSSAELHLPKGWRERLPPGGRAAHPVGARTSMPGRVEASICPALTAHRLLDGELLPPPV